MFNKATLIMALFALQAIPTNAFFFWNQGPYAIENIEARPVESTEGDKANQNTTFGAIAALAKAVADQSWMARFGPNGEKIYQCPGILNAPGNSADMCEFFIVHKRNYYTFGTNYDKPEMKLNVEDKCECSGYYCEMRNKISDRWHCFKGQLKDAPKQ